MCGLVGIASNNLIATDKTIFTTLLYLDELRGEHSTGVCAISKDGSSHVYKKALKASDFIQIKGYGHVLAKADRVLMGHNRYATMGARDDNNAHPFQHNHITLVHNGTLTSKHKVNKCNNTFITDSETVAWAISTDDTVEVLERLEGAYALVWYDSEDKVLHFARNDERPLYLGKIGNDVVWASEKAMLELVAEHHKRTLTDVELLPVGELRMYDLDKLSDGPTSLKFTPHVAPPAATYYSSGTQQHRRRRNNFNAVVNTMEGTLVEVRHNGYLEAIADDGSKITGNISVNNIPAFQAAAVLGKRIMGTIASESSRWTKKDGYLDYYFLTGPSISIINEDEVADSGTEKKCNLCQSSTVEEMDEFEYHYGEYYHTSCLNSQYNHYGEQ